MDDSYDLDCSYVEYYLRCVAGEASPETTYDMMIYNLGKGVYKGQVNKELG